MFKLCILFDLGVFELMGRNEDFFLVMQNFFIGNLILRKSGYGINIEVVIESKFIRFFFFRGDLGDWEDEISVEDDDNLFNGGGFCLSEQNLLIEDFCQRKKDGDCVLEIFIIDL